MYEFPFSNNSIVCMFINRVSTEGAKRGLEIADMLADIYLFHRKFQTKEYKESCSRIWTDE